MQKVVSNIEKLLPEKKIPFFSQNNIIAQFLPYWMNPIIILLTLLQETRRPYLLLLIFYGGIPLLDQIFQLDIANPSKNESKKMVKYNLLFKLPIYAIIILDWIYFIKTLIYFSNFQISTTSLLLLIGQMYLFANINSIQFSIAHQVFHKQNIFDRCLGTLHMSKLLYMHFTYEHIFGHHKKVATPEDPASAQKGITVYKFAIRSFIGTFKSVYKMQKQQNKPFYFNYAILSIFSSIIFTSCIGFLLGFQAMILFFICAIISIFYLQAINYIEHYGLRRQKLTDGSYEKVTIRHSWNAPHRFTNYMLYKLQRHSDHHQNSLKPYQTLLTLDQSPHLPHGYGLIVTMALFSKVWFKVMDPLVDEYKRLKTGNINGEVMLKAIKQVRLFGIELIVSLSILCIFSNLLTEL